MDEALAPWWLALAIVVAVLALAVLLRQAQQASRLRERADAAAREREARIAELSARLALLRRSAQAGELEVELPGGRVDDADGAAAALLGHARVAPSVAAWRRLAHPADRAAIVARLRALFAGERDRVDAKLRLKAADGRWRWCRLQARLVARDAAGRPARLAAMLLDIDHAERTERQASASRRAFARGPVAPFEAELAPPHRLLAASDSLVEARGAPAEVAPLGEPLAQLVHPDDRGALLDGAAEAIGAPGRAVVRELRLLRADLEARWQRLQLVADADDDRPLLRGWWLDLGPLKTAEARAAAHDAEALRVVARLQSAQRFQQQLQQLTERLQLCSGELDATELIEAAGPELMPRWAGAVSMADAAGAMTLPMHWGDFPAQWPAAEADCWALRRRRLHLVGADGPGLAPQPVCQHHGGMLPRGVAHAICVPLELPNGRDAALHLVRREAEDDERLRSAQWAAQTLADALALALDNLRLKQALHEQAVRDGLTGLFNRRYFDEALEHELARAGRSGDTLSLALLDIDHFKSFNDAFGHAAGDAVLRAVAAELQGFVRSYDIACRYGGEELALLMPRAHVDETCARLESLRERIAGLALEHDGVELPTVTVSIGVADTDSGDELLRRADAALYAAKNGGRNRLARAG